MRRVCETCLNYPKKLKNVHVMYTPNCVCVCVAFSWGPWLRGERGVATYTYVSGLASKVAVCIWLNAAQQPRAVYLAFDRSPSDSSCRPCYVWNVGNRNWAPLLPYFFARNEPLDGVRVESITGRKPFSMRPQFFYLLFFLPLYKYIQYIYTSLSPSPYHVDYFLRSTLLSVFSLPATFIGWKQIFIEINFYMKFKYRNVDCRWVCFTQF